VSYEILETYKIGERPSVTEASLAAKKAVDQGVTA
jgi:sarcosine oxidase subunit delta